MLLQGGASLQVAMIPMNFRPAGASADYVVTGTWSKTAAKEAAKLGTNHLAANMEAEGFNDLPAKLELDPKAAYLHFTSNETNPRRGIREGAGAASGRPADLRRIVGFHQPPSRHLEICNDVACIGPVLTLPPRHPMFLGNLQRQTLPEVLDRAELNPVLHTIRVWGPQKLVSLLKENGYDVILPKAYICNCTCDVCYKLLSDERIVAVLEQILQDEQVRHTIAYGRLYYLQETAMAERFQLPATAGPDPRRSHD